MQPPGIPASVFCLSCHSGWTQAVAYSNSPHVAVTKGPSCQSCHNPGLNLNPPVPLNHPGYSPIDTAAKPGLYYSCVTCHYPGSTIVTSWPPAGFSFHSAYTNTNKCVLCHNPHTTVFNGNLPYPHFANSTTSAQFVNPNVTCANCHSAVDAQGTPSFNIYSANYQWAESGKGNPKSPAYVTYQFKSMGTPAPATPATSTANDCVRCHTTTGYINYVSSSFTNIAPFGPALGSREMVACSACHDPTPFSPTFSRRSIGIETDPSFNPGVYNVVTWYGYSSYATKKLIRPKPFVNSGGSMYDSNICIACHTGKAVGDLIKLSTNCNTLPSIACRVGVISTFWANVDFIDPHNMNAANLMFPDGLRAGYEYRTSSYIPAHTNIGLDTTGPCVGCHMTSPQKHSFSVVSTATNGTITAIITNICSTCHGYSTFSIDAATLQIKKDGYQAALAVITAQLTAKGIYYNAAKAPYFFKVSDPVQQTVANRVVNWNYSVTFQGANLLGAAFNLRLMQPNAGWIHNSTYVKRVIYDTIDYLDDGLQNSTVPTAIQNADLDSTTKARALAYISPRL